MGEELVDQIDVAARGGALTTAQSVALVGTEDVQLYGLWGAGSMVRPVRGALGSRVVWSAWARTGFVFDASVFGRPRSVAGGAGGVPGGSAWVVGAAGRLG